MHMKLFVQHGLSHEFALDEKTFKTRMWANAKRDGRPVEYRCRPLVNAAKFD